MGKPILTHQPGQINSTQPKLSHLEYVSISSENEVLSYGYVRITWRGGDTQDTSRGCLNNKCSIDIENSNTVKKLFKNESKLKLISSLYIKRESLKQNITI